MKTVNRKVEILWKYNPSTFEKMNKDVLGEPFRKVGSSITAVNKIISNENSAMLRFLMPSFLGIDPDSKDVNWDSHIKNYWDSLSVDISSGGRNLETGFSFSLDDNRRSTYIEKLAKENNIKSDEDLADFVMGFKGSKPNVPEEYKWKYGEPLNTEDYLLWRYVLNYKHVANDITDINKSPNIRFYLHTQEDRDKIKKDAAKLKREALTAYTEFVNNASIDDYNDVLSILTPDSIRDIVSNKDLDDKQSVLMEQAINEPKKFIELVKDKNLKNKATIQRMIAFGVLKQLPGSTVIVESADPSVIIGNNMDEAITFITNEKNKVKLNELTAKYKAITK